MIDSYLKKERKLYAAYEEAKSKRRTVFYSLEDQGYSHDEIYATSKYRKAYNRARKTFRVWDDYCQTRKDAR